jgi:hypothetical protein
MEISTVNRELQVFRRMFHLATEWGKTEKVLPRVRMIPGESIVIAWFHEMKNYAI